MKKLFTLLVLHAAISTLPSSACTNLIVGKEASGGKSVFVTYSADNYGTFGSMYFHRGGKHPKGEMRKILDGDTNRPWGEIPQASETYRVIGQMNEYQVSVCETTFGGREELCDSTGIIDYTSLMHIALERATTAREAIKVMTELVAKYGYNSEGESFSICDKNEAWIMEMIGKGPGNRGANWVAVRIPDDCICAHANQSRITRFNLKDKKNVLYSKDIIKFAREKGYFTGEKDAEFSFRDAFAPSDFSATRYCEARVWSLFNHFYSGMNEYTDYAFGLVPVTDPNARHTEMPLYVKPDKSVTLESVMAAMRDHYEDTPLDFRNQPGAGPYQMPYLPTPLSWELDGKKYFNERPVSTQQASFCVVCQMRAGLPDAIGGIVWFTNDDPNMAPFTPVYCGSSEVPVCYRRIPGKQDDLHYSTKSAFWLQNTVANCVYPYYSKMFPDLQQVRDSFETATIKEKKMIEDVAKGAQMSHPDKYTKILTDYSKQQADRMMKRWQQLFEFLQVKHIDMAVRPQEENGKFKRNPYGLAAPVQRPGYPEPYRRRIVEETKDRYLIK
ncbi:MAG: C69 family dipeptidase [Bacteroidaceae bacterium]|nr:C69 family dipeptidase [Bacteroidaceae bacterium]